MPEEINTGDKQDGVNSPGNHYPLPQPVFNDKIMSLKIALYGYDYFLKQ